MTASEAAKLVAVLLQVYPQAQFGPASSAIYERLLGDLDYAMASAAVDQLAKTSRWMPTIAEIRTAAAELKHGPRRLGAEAWGDVGVAIRKVGAYRPAPVFADALVGECVRLMGWRNLCASENGAADRARFIELYDGLAERNRVETIAAPRLEAPKPMVFGALAAGIGRTIT